MRKKLFLVLSVIIVFFLISCKSEPDIRHPMEKNVESGMQVRGIVLKYALFDSLYEIYQANVLSVEDYGSYYSGCEKRENDHYNWLLKTYASFGSENRKDLNTIFNEIHIWQLLDIMTATADDTDINDLIKIIDTAGKIPAGAKKALLNILPEFYDVFLNDYIIDNFDYYNTKASDFNIKLQNYSNPFKVIESQTGVELGDFSPLFYLTFRKVGAYGFTYGNLKISTIQGNIRIPEHIMSTALHEFLHGFFQTFTGSGEFKELAEKLKNVDEFYGYWETRPSLTSSYSWRGFCEENLVEGFAKYLGYTFYDIENPVGIYFYDYDFFEYLLSIDYSVDDPGFKKAAFDFYESKLGDSGLIF